MRRALLVALLALPLAGFDCGGSAPRSSGPVPCDLAVGGALSEKMFCVVTVYDYSQLTPSTPTFTFDLAAYRSMSDLGAGVAFSLPARPAMGTAYGWDSATAATNVDGGDATRYDPSMAATHQARAPFGDAGTGRLSVTLTRIPAATATGAELLDVHGSLTATLPSIAAGAAVTLSATF